jgi:hypothetical protein
MEEAWAMKGLSEAGYKALEAELSEERRDEIDKAIAAAIEIELLAELDILNHQASEAQLADYHRWRRNAEWIASNGEDRGAWPGRAR